MSQTSLSDSEDYQRLVQHAVGVIKRSFDLYGAEGLAFSFNGGKDSTVLLHLLLHVAKKRCERDGKAWSPEQGLLGVTVFFFLRPDEFPEVAEFVRAADVQHHLHLQVYECDFAKGVQELIDTRPIKAIFLGTRHGDPNCRDQEFFCPSSEGWPVFMRINPILNWTYQVVWAYLKQEQAQYCSLYDHGFTSLGSVHNTVPNSALLCEDGTYAPAHTLTDDRLERAGRQDKRGYHKQHSQQAECAHCAALVLVGDELLSGKVVDRNAPFLLPRLHALGWKVCKVSIVPDSVPVISREVRQLMDACDVVITCGGVGPTKDDCTMEAIAVATDTKLSVHPRMAASLRAYFKDKATESHMKMAETPEGRTNLIHYNTPAGTQSHFPLLRVDNVFVLPGVPALVQQKWLPLKRHLVTSFGGHATPFHNRVIKLALADEAAVAAPFEALVDEFPDIAAGSYPSRSSSGEDLVLISLEARDEEYVVNAVVRFKELLDACADPALHSEACIVDVQEDVTGLDNVSN